MSQQYQVCGPLAVLTADTPHGLTKVTLYKGALVPAGATEKEIAHHLSIGFIRPFGAVAPVEPVEPVVSAPTLTPAVGEGELSQERRDAQAELPGGGAAPKPAQSKAVWVEYAVAKGYDYDTANAATKAELMDLLKQG